MKSGPWIIIAGDNTWKVGGPDDRSRPDSLTTVPVSAEGEPPDAFAQKLGAALAARSYGGEPVTLTLPSHWCLPATISLDGLPRKNRRHFMVYRFEERIPLAVEEVAVEFISPDGSSTAALGVAAQIKPIQPLVDAIERAGINLAAIAPISMLALQSLLGTSRAERCDAVAWGTDGKAELFILAGGRPSAWYVTGTAPHDLALYICAHAPAGADPLRVLCVNGGHDPGPALMELPGVKVTAVVQRSMEEAAIDAIAYAESGGPLWFDFRRVGLSSADPGRELRSGLVRIGVAVALLWGAMCGGMLWRANWYRHAAARSEQRLEDVYRATFPAKSIPASILSRLESERKRLGGMSGEGASHFPVRGAALLLFHDTLAHLPRDLRYRVADLRWTDDRLYVEGQSRSHADANVIAEALRQDKTLVVESPQTEQQSNQAVGFVITGVRNTAAGSVKRGDR